MPSKREFHGVPNFKMFSRFGRKGETPAIFTPQLVGQLTGREVIHIAPDPGFSRFDGAYQRMLRFMIVLGGMFVLGRVAAAHIVRIPGTASDGPRCLQV